MMAPREARLLGLPGGMSRLLWKRLYRALRLSARAEHARLEHELLHGVPGAPLPRGVLHISATVAR
jgi:hypothetical protein